MNKRRLIITSIVSIFLVAILMIGSTYSVFTSQDIEEDLNVYKTGNLDVTYTLSKNNITITDNLPKSIEEANTIVPYRITVTNKGNVPYQFDVILEDTSAGEKIDYQYIMTKVGYLEPKSFGACTNNVIKEDVILPAGSSVDIDVRVWLSDTTRNSEMGKSFYAKLKIDGLAIYDDFNPVDNSILSLNYMKMLFSYPDDDSYFHSSNYLEKIKNISFVDYINTTNVVEQWDVSQKQDNSIVAWITNNETSGYYDLYIGSDREIFSEYLDSFFYKMTNLDSINFSNLNTALTKSMNWMFAFVGYRSSNLQLDLGNKFDTSNVKSMIGMFNYTGYFNSKFTLNLGEKFDTNNVTNMESMFANTGYNNTQFVLNLGKKFDTSNVTDMNFMFDGTGEKNNNFELDISTFTFDKVIQYNLMFNGFTTTKKIYVKDANAQKWILDKAFSNLSSSNVLIKN